MLKQVIAMLIGAVIFFGGSAAGYTVGYGLGYMKGTFVKINPFKKDRQNGNLVPFFPGEQAPIGAIGDSPVTLIEEPDE